MKRLAWFTHSRVLLACTKGRTIASLSAAELSLIIVALHSFQRTHLKIQLHRPRLPL